MKPYMKRFHTVKKNDVVDCWLLILFYYSIILNVSTSIELTNAANILPWWEFNTNNDDDTTSNNNNNKITNQDKIFWNENYHQNFLIDNNDDDYDDYEKEEKDYLEHDEVIDGNILHDFIHLITEEQLQINEEWKNNKKQQEQQQQRHLQASGKCVTTKKGLSTAVKTGVSTINVCTSRIKMGSAVRRRRRRLQSISNHSNIFHRNPIPHRSNDSNIFNRTLQNENRNSPVQSPRRRRR